MKGKNKAREKPPRACVERQGCGAAKARSRNVEPEPMLEKLLLNVVVKSSDDQRKKRVLLFDTDAATS